MAALAVDIDSPHKGPLTKLTVKAVGADTFYKGAFVFGDAANGKAQVTAPATGDVFLGVCAEQVVATAADDPVDIYVEGTFAFAMATPVEGDVGDVCVVDIAGGTNTDNPADAVTGNDATLAATDILIGKILAIDIEETTRAWVKIDPGWIYSTTIGWI